MAMFTYLLIYSIEQIPTWEFHLLKASKEFPQILEKAKVYYLIYKCPQTVTILGQFDPLHNLHLTS
jgi:hypothetical protein